MRYHLRGSSSHSVCFTHDLFQYLLLAAFQNVVVVVSNASDFRVKEGNMFLAAAGSGLVGVTLPTNEEITIVDSDGYGFPPAVQIVDLIKARRKD